jgi:hypothetical protein
MTQLFQTSNFVSILLDHVKWPNKEVKMTNLKIYYPYSDIRFFNNSKIFSCKDSFNNETKYIMIKYMKILLETCHITYIYM